jgi:glycerol uptake facilitator-like aquaporin
MDLQRRLAAETVGTAMLLAAVVGSGIMGERLAGGNVAIALLANTIATGAALVALILTFGPISGAHFNPAVTIVDASQQGAYVARCAALHRGAARWRCRGRLRRTGAQLFSEFVATFGLLAVICLRPRRHSPIQPSPWPER